ncbi:hypothetical protein F3Y22_tig00116984pilonHSYRG00269 [Hibiscus syriacus]|uniref:Uncharacterized protein n=1 Tax=Hibiscus syriacus TaxID=106335 RepID=A0A6A2X6Q0_HIBSY|nr:hypothetical protein F3Y22_tig00116984pilonHSYRG00269 [Hibiscus syriacus]
MLLSCEVLDQKIYNWWIGFKLERSTYLGHFDPCTNIGVLTMMETLFLKSKILCVGLMMWDKDLREWVAIGSFRPYLRDHPGTEEDDGEFFDT